jgi:branched-chain amino acid transport system permease protein
MTRLGWIALAAGLAALIVLPLGLKNYGIYLLSLWALYAIAAQGLNLTLGYAGQVSLGQAAFLGVGAYTAAILIKAGLSFWAALPAAAALCFVIGLLLGFPALRVQHHYLAFATLGFNALVYLALRNEEWLTGGTFGIRRIPRPELFGHSFRPPLDFYYLCLAALIVVTLALWWILRSPWGRAFAALRDNPIRAESLGIDIRAYTLLAFAIGATCAGIAGAFFAPLVQFIDPSPFGLGASLAFLLMVVVGGSGRFFGPFLGAALVTLLPEWLRFAESYYLLVYAVLVVILMVYCPGGLLAIPDKLRAHRKERAAGLAGTPSRSVP